MSFGDRRSGSPSIKDRPHYRIRMVAARERLNISQEELANKVYLSRSRIAGIENGYADPTLRSAKEISKILCIEDYREMLETFEYVEERGRKKWVGSEGSIITL